MLTEICEEVKNWFVKSDDDKSIGQFKISGGVITPSLDLKTGQYFRIIGSLFNDGVHKYGDASDVLTNEEFDGAVWKMTVPPAVISLDTDISNYVANNTENSPYTSESFGGYSYSKATDANGVPVTWRNVFSARLNNWRKIL